MNIFESLQNFKFGHLNIPNSIVFWSKQYCYCMLPVVQLLPGHVLVVPKRAVLSYQELEPSEIFDISLTLRILTKSIETVYNCESTTISIQSFNKKLVDQDCINHCFVHVLPRRQNDIKKSDGLYPLLDNYEKEYQRSYKNKFISFQKHYANTIAIGNAHSMNQIHTLSLEANRLREVIEQNVNEDKQLGKIGKI